MAIEMKNSGIAWIGDIPIGWNVHRVKNGFVRKNEKAKTDDPVVLSLARSGVRVRNLENAEGQIAESYFDYNPVEPGDLLLNPMDLYSGANCSISRVSGVISPAYINLKAKRGYCPEYYDYFFKTQYWSMAMFAHGKGVSFDNRWTISAVDLFNYYIPYPSYDEQCRISDYLNAECSQIDSIIEKTRKSIEEYKKLKQSIITQAVTKGVSADRIMKDSGMQWVNEIPKNWITPKVLQCLQMPITDGPHTTPELFDDGIPFISAEAVSTGNGRINFDHMRGYISKDFYEECCKKYIPQMDDVYMIKSGATTGRVAIVDTDRVFTIWSPLATFRADKKRILPYFLFYCLQADYVQKQIENGWTYGTQQNIGMRTIEKIKLCLPPIEEQETIVSYLKVKISEVNRLIEKKEILLSELERYKKAVIFEHVTGKKEVPA